MFRYISKIKMWDSVLNTVAVFIILLISLYLLRRRKWKNFPPGPPGLPLVGYAPFLGKNPSKTMVELSKKYGPIFSVQIGSQTWVILNEYDILQEALVKSGDIFSGRPQFHMYARFAKNMGIGLVDYGHRWKEQRKFGMKSLKRFGFGKSSMEDYIREEAELLAKEFETQEGNPFNCQGLFSTAVSNVISRMTFGQRFDYDDKYFKDMVALMNASLSGERDGYFIQIMIMAPFTRYLPYFWGAYNRFADSRVVLMDVMQEIIDDHKETLDRNNMRDFIDEFLIEMEKNNSENSTFTELQLIHYISDVFIGGTESTSSTLRWCVLALAHYPKMQEKILQEIKETSVLTNRSMNDRAKMPYTCAFLHEVLRYRPLLPIALAHKATKEVFFRGYHIPKDTVVIPHLWAVHFDEKNFPKPEKFRPERFIGDDNCFHPDRRVITFSLGPRTCLGEQLARAELFHFLTAVVERFQILPDADYPLPQLADGVFGAVYAPQQFKVRFTPR